jgi:hypothetical protein
VRIALGIIARSTAASLAEFQGGRAFVAMAAAAGAVTVLFAAGTGMQCIGFLI